MCPNGILDNLDENVLPFVSLGVSDLFLLCDSVCVARGLVLIDCYVPADDLLIQPKKPFFFHPYLTKFDFRCRKRNLEHRVYSLPATKVQIGHLGLFHLQILNRDNFLKNFFI